MWKYICCVYAYTLDRSISKRKHVPLDTCSYEYDAYCLCFYEKSLFLSVPAQIFKRHARLKQAPFLARGLEMELFSQQTRER